MAKSMGAVLVLLFLGLSLSGCYVGVRAGPGPGWHRCGWGWCR